LVGPEADLLHYTSTFLVPAWQRTDAHPNRRFCLTQAFDGRLEVSDARTREIVAAHWDPEVVGMVLALELERWMTATLPKRVVMHAGAVGLGAQCLLLPGASGAGKSTLVRALLDLGASYFNDDKVVVDRSGVVWPYRRPLSLLPAEGGMVQRISPEEVGATSAGGPLPIGLVAFTTFEKGASWNQTELTPGTAVALLLSHITNAIGRPRLAFAIAERVVSSSPVIQSARGEATAAARELVEIFARSADR
jgi:hypothetical protein